jgi:hypothetical protein
MPGQGTFEQRRGIHADLPLERLDRVRAQALHQAQQTSLQHVVVILAPGIAGDPSQFVAAEAGRIRLRPVVKLAHTQDRASGGQQLPGIVAQVGAAVRQISHLTREAVCDPLAIVTRFRNGAGRGYTRKLESAFAGESLDLLGMH